MTVAAQADVPIRESAVDDGITFTRMSDGSIRVSQDGLEFARLSNVEWQQVVAQLGGHALIVSEPVVWRATGETPRPFAMGGNVAPPTHVVVSTLKAGHTCWWPPNQRTGPCPACPPSGLDDSSCGAVPVSPPKTGGGGAVTVHVHSPDPAAATRRLDDDLMRRRAIAQRTGYGY